MTEIQQAAAALGRARRLFLSGDEPPYLARFSPKRMRGADRDNVGVAGERVAAIWRHWEAIDAATASLTRRVVPFAGDVVSPADALARIADEPLREVRAGLANGLARESRDAARALADAWALVADDAAANGAATLVSARTRDCAERLLAASEEPVRDVLEWATKHEGRPGRAQLAWHDVVRALRNPTLDALFHPRVDPWTALLDWRKQWRAGQGANPEGAAGEPAIDDLGFEVASGGYCASWAMRGRQSSRVGVTSWPGAVRQRFALQALGSWDALSEAGVASLLPLDESAVGLPAALWPLMLSEPTFAPRLLGIPTIGADALRLLALAEVLFNRLGAAAVLVLDEFQRARAVDPALEAAEVHFARALYAPLQPELGLLLCRPFGGPGLTAPPDAVLGAHLLADGLRQDYDVDWWRNPRSVEPLRAIWSRTASESLEALVPNVEGAAGEESLRRWLEAKLGG